MGGEVIGSVLVEHPEPFDEHTNRQITDSVAEAAPVIANLRNLAIAEMRAATDGLTGLPNQRAVHETLKRMVAQAGRTLEPLAMVLFDLDRFKAINDTFGHGRGDDVLAAVGDVAAHTIRGSDFVGPLGGEEFAVLLPGTDREGALKVAENMREAIAVLTVAGVDRDITASFGVAVLPEDAAGRPGAAARRRPRALPGEGERARSRRDGRGLARVHSRRQRSTMHARACCRDPAGRCRDRRRRDRRRPHGRGGGRRTARRPRSCSRRLWPPRRPPPTRAPPA